MPVAETAMLIRRPVAEVFEAFIDPAITSKFWFTRSSGRLEQGHQVQWDWEMYDLSIQVNVTKRLAPPRSPLLKPIEWVILVFRGGRALWMGSNPNTIDNILRSVRAPNRS
jgi:hypothetical protein